MGYSSWGCKESDAIEQLGAHTHTRAHVGERKDCDVPEKAKLWRQQSDQWLPGWVCEARDEWSTGDFGDSENTL